MLGNCPVVQRSQSEPTRAADFAGKSLWFESALLPSGWAPRVRFSLAKGCIARVDIDCDPLEADERHFIALPGLPNVHSHGFQRGMAGLTELRGASADNFWSWRELMYRFVDRLQPEDLEALTAQAYVEMLESGTTRVGEFHYLHHAPDGRPYANLGEMTDRVLAAASTTGIGLTLLPVLYCHSGFGGAAPHGGQRRFINNTDQFARLLDDARPKLAKFPDSLLGVAPHSLRAVTPEQLRIAIALAGDAPLHIHAAEQTQEVDDCVAWSGERPVEWLLNHNEVAARWCLIHATHLNDTEVKRLAASHAVAGLCPMTEANLGDGIFRARDYLSAGGCLGIGSDSNVLLDVAAELRQLEYSQRLAHRARNVLACVGSDSTGRTLFDAALRGGMQALGQNRTDTGLTIGAVADIVSLDGQQPALLERQGDALLDSWIFAAGRSAVDCVWRRGSKFVVSGRHIHRATIATRFQQSLRRLLS